MISCINHWVCWNAVSEMWMFFTRSPSSEWDLQIIGKIFARVLTLLISFPVIWYFYYYSMNWFFVELASGAFLCLHISLFPEGQPNTIGPKFYLPWLTSDTFSVLHLPYPHLSFSCTPVRNKNILKFLPLPRWYLLGDMVLNHQRFPFTFENNSLSLYISFTDGPHHYLNCNL